MTAPYLFGTDGIRAHVSSPLLRPNNVMRLAQILARRANESKPKDERARVVIGRDTRLSGPYILQAMLAGFTSMGVDCYDLGVLPTSAVANYTKENKANFGIMISASHNPHHDNGLKVFDSLGFKIALEQELSLTKEYFSEENLDPNAYAVQDKPGTIYQEAFASQKYAKNLRTLLHNDDALQGLKLAIDCAHGAASFIAEDFFSSLGAKVYLVGKYEEGRDINRDCGSESPTNIINAVQSTKAQLGMAFDGDADRVIFVDEKGELIDGDAILAVIAIYLKSEGKLKKDTLVATIMSSMALDDALSLHHIRVVRTLVGDKFVARKMLEEGYSFGGENSGHLIIFPNATTGDGIASAMLFASILRRSGKAASELVSFFVPTPKILCNFVIEEKVPLENLPHTKQAIITANQQLQNKGRVMLRYSGTENKARLLVEAPTRADCELIAKNIGDAFLAELLESICHDSRTKSCQAKDVANP